jgi:hypothetical protein
LLTSCNLKRWGCLVVYKDLVHRRVPTIRHKAAELPTLKRWPVNLPLVQVGTDGPPPPSGLGGDKAVELVDRAVSACWGCAAGFAPANWAPP